MNRFGTFNYFNQKYKHKIQVWNITYFNQKKAGCSDMIQASNLPKLKR